MAGYPMNPMMAGAMGGYGMGGGQGGMNPMAMMGYMDPNLLGAQREIDFGQGLMGEGTSTAPAYPMQALARALQGVVGGYETRHGMEKFGEAFSGGQGQGGQDPVYSTLADTFGPHHWLTNAWAKSANSPYMRVQLLQQVIPKAMEQRGAMKVGPNEQVLEGTAGGGFSPVGGSTAPPTDEARLVQYVQGLPAGPERDQLMTQLRLKQQIEPGVTLNPDGSASNIPGAVPAMAAVTGAKAGATAAATLPADLTKIGAGAADAAAYEPVTIQVPDGQGGMQTIQTTRGKLASAIGSGAGGPGVGPVQQPVPPPGGGAAPGGPAAAPPGAAAQPAVTGAVTAPQGFYGASAGAPAPDTGVAPAPAPQAGGAPGRMAGTAAPTNAGQPPMPAPGEKPQAAPVSGVPNIPGISVANAPNPAFTPLIDADTKEVAADRDLAHKGLQDMATVRAIQDFLPKVKTGWGSETRLEGARILTAFGVSPEAVKDFTSTDPAAGQLLTKKFLELSAGAARGMGAREPGSVIMLFGKAYPNLGTDERAIRLQTNALYMDRMRQTQLAIDKTNYLNESVNSTNRTGQYRGLHGFDEGFNQAHPSESYLRAAEAMTGGEFSPWGHVGDPAQQQAIINLIPSGTPYMAPDGQMRVKR